MENMTEYQKNLIRMWDSLRKDCKGKERCNGVACDDCPLNVVCKGEGIQTRMFNIEKATEIVTQWAKEHPVITNEDKYKEVFGVEPKNESGQYVCPRYAGFFKGEIDNCALIDGCIRCTKDFWQSEYKEPKKGMSE